MTHSYKFLDLPSSAQSVALGGSLLTYVGTNPGLGFENPSLYGQETAGRLALSYFHYMRGISAVNALYGLGFGDRGTWAVGVKSMLYGNMQGYNEQDVPTEKFSAMDASVEGLVSYDLTDKIRGGLSLKMIYGHIGAYNAFAIASSAGLSYYDSPSGVSVALAITNVGGTLKSYGSKRSLPPWDIRLGYSQALHHAPFRFHALVHGLAPYHIRSMGAGEKITRKMLRHIAVGVEFTPSEQFWVGVGFNPNVAFDLAARGGKSLGGLSAGLGFSGKHFGVSIATAMYHPQVMGFMFSVHSTLGSERYIF